MKNYINKLDDFLDNEELEDGVEVCDPKTGICYIKSKDGLIERKVIEKKLVVEDGRELLTEQMPISHSSKTYLR